MDTAGLVGGVRMTTPVGNLGLDAGSLSVHFPPFDPSTVKNCLPSPLYFEGNALLLRKISFRTFLGGIGTSLRSTSFSLPSLFLFER